MNRSKCKPLRAWFNGPPCSWMFVSLSIEPKSISLSRRGVPRSAATKSRYFREVYDAVREMKETLKKMAPEVNAAEYMLVEKFLDELIDKARLKLDPTKDTSSKPSSETAE